MISRAFVVCSTGLDEDDMEYMYHVAAYDNEDQAELHAKKANEFNALYYKEDRRKPYYDRHKNPWDHDKAISIEGSKPFYVVELMMYSHFDEFQEEKKIT